MTDTTTNRVDLSTATYTERRRALLHAVKTIGPDHFDMADWARIATAPAYRFLTPREVVAVVPDVEAIDCSTAVCLIGTAICQYFGLHTDIPFREQWDGINLSDDRRTLDQIAFDYMDHPDGNEHEADWLAVLDYLADLIEHDQ